MKSFLRICLVYLCMLALLHAHTQAQAPVISQMELFRVGIVAASATPTNIPTNTPIYLYLDQNVVNSVGAAFTTDQDITTLLGLSDGAALPFSATINGRKITIIPSMELISSSPISITLNAGGFYNTVLPFASAVANTIATFSFTTATLITPVAPATLTLCTNGAAKVLDPITITEGSSASFGQGLNQTFEMNAPTGFNFVAGLGNIVVSGGTDIFNASMLVTATKITLLYSINSNYANINTITLQDIQVVYVSGAGTPNLVRTGGNATQAGNRQNQSKIHATFASTAPPAAPTSVVNINLCSGFTLTTTSNITVPTGSTAYFYNAFGTQVYTELATGTTVSVSAADLGYVSNTTLGASQFSVSAIVGTCESVRVPFTITVNPEPVVNLIVFSGSLNICKPEQTTFQALGTPSATFVFEVSTNGFTTSTTTTGAFYTTSTIIPTNSNYQVRVQATLGTCVTVSNTLSFTVNPKPVVGFTWISGTTFATSNPAQNLTDGINFGGTIAGVVSNLGTYSGSGVGGTQFSPALAGIGTHIVTYFYTDGNGCSNEASVSFTVAASTNLIPFLGTSYCSNAPTTLALIPNGGSSALTPIASIPTGLVSSPYLGVPILGSNQFYFPTLPGMNQGIVWNNVDYTFNPAAVTFAGSDSFTDVDIVVVTFINLGLSYFPITRNTSVRVYRLPVINVNLVNNTNFCRATSAPLTITPLIFGLAPTTGTTDIEYRISMGTFATLPSNTITPATLPAGNYELRVTHTTPQGCASSLIRDFEISNNPTPTFSITNASNIGISNICENETIIRFVTPISISNGTYTVTRVTGATNQFTASATTTNIPLSSLDGVGNYQVTLTVTNLAGCTGTSVVGTFNIIARPLPNFTFAPAATNVLTICEDATSFSLIPNTGALPAGSGFFNIKKTTVAGTGKDFGAGIITFDPTTNFDAASGLGAGKYEIKYTYTTFAGGCTNTSIIKELTIAPRPSLDFSLSTTDVCNYANIPNITLIPTWLNAGVNVFVPASGRVNIYNSVGGFLLQLPSGVNVIDPDNGVLASTISASAITTFQVRYEYTDNNGCVGISPPKTFNVNPLPLPTISFIGANEFCLFTPGNANFTVNATGAFDATKGFITIRNAPSAPIATPALTQVLLNNVNTFNPSSLGGGGVGEYFVDYTYTDAASCQVTVTCPVRLILKFYTAPQFLFPVTVAFPLGSPSFEICENVTSFTLVPSLLNTTAYGTDNPLVSSRGEYTITKGTFTALVTGIDSFNPNTLLVNAVGGGTGTYNIKYTYTSARGCVGESTIRQLIINPVPLVSFDFVPATPTSIDTFGNGFFCADFTNIGLTPSISGAGVRFSIQEINVLPLPAPIIITPPASSSPTITRGDLSMIIPTTTVKTYQVTFLYTNTNGCVGISPMRTLTIIPVPQPLFTVAPQRCVNIPVLFNATTSIIQPPIVDAVASYTWDFDDSSPIEITTSQTISHIFTAPGSFNVSLTITSVLGCTKTTITTVIIGAIPVASFTTANFCQGTTTTFASTSTLLGSGSITTYDWIFGDTTPAIIVRTTTPNTTYLYNAPGRYTVSLTVTTNSLCTNTFTREVLIFPRITPTAAVPYKENFDTNDGFWLANGLIKSTVNPTLDIVGYSWAGGVPTGAKINASTTAGGAWSTKTNANTFYPNERSYVESPCFNFSDPTLTKPIISMKIWYDTDRGSDGAVLYASKNDGITWNVVGTINEGIEWYNTAGVIAQPGGQPVVNAWTGNNLTGYKIAKFNLDQFKTEPSVRFRIAFGSNGDNPVGAGVAFDGFAFDEVFIGNRNRIALLEHFTNASSSEANTENTVINNFPPGLPQNEVYNIQYHTNVPGLDPMNADNTADPSARALFYGVSQVPRTAIDGVIENRKFSEWGSPIYNRRTLETAPFELSVDFSSTTQMLRFKANVKALEPFTRRVILQTAVVEQEILGSVFTSGNFGGLTFKNVVKKMIPNSAGTLIAQTWLQNTQFQTGELTWSPTNVYNGNRLVLVVFVQDEITKEVYQTGFFNITTNISSQDPTTALDNTMLENEFVIYPNPAQNEVFTGFRQETVENFSVTLFDSYGKKIDTFSLTKGNKGLLLSTEKYASGMYFVEITGKNNSQARRKLVIAK